METKFTEETVKVSMERMIYILTGKGKDEFLRGLGHNEFCNENEGEGRKTCSN